jgi:hypothetical protein
MRTKPEVRGLSENRQACKQVASVAIRGFRDGVAGGVRTDCGQRAAGAPGWLAAAHAQALSVPVQKSTQQLTPVTIPGLQTVPDLTGWLGTYQPGGATITAGNAFFQSLGSNGVTCFTCHQPQWI